MPAVLRDAREVVDPDTGEITVPNNSRGGRRFHYLCYLPGGTDIVFTDTVTNIIDFLIAGYSDLPNEEEAAVARITLADSIARILQSQVLLDVDRASFTDEEWATLNAPRVGSAAAQADWWRSNTPLYVVETTYEPYTDIPRPAAAGADTQESTIRWIRPADEEDFLLSLHEVGFIRLMENTETSRDDEAG
jgi:hypothetical protein